MTTTTVPPRADAGGAPVTQLRVVKSEWIKFWSLRSTTVTLVVTVLLLVGVGLIASSVFGNGDTGGPGDDGPQNPIDVSLAGLNLAQLALATLGVLFMAGEYSTGMIRSSLAAVPKRLPVLWAKIAVFTGVSFVVGLLASAIAFTGGQAIIGDLGASWSDPGVVRAVVGTAVVLAGFGLFGVALGTLLRSTPAAISTIVGVMFLLPGIAGLLLPDSWGDNVTQVLPPNAAEAFTDITRNEGTLSPWAGLAVFAAYLVATTLAAAWRLRRTDA
ncbi:ABC transporter permease [Streptomyces sp. NPDC002680]|uniref:ABC transporter permease n=1 Tax=Streptomyces sp. NPDC002680 TaxID=3364659 RepID=UPI003699B78C